jgi:hypothetical protein
MENFMGNGHARWAFGDSEPSVRFMAAAYNRNQPVQPEKKTPQKHAKTKTSAKGTKIRPREDESF